MIKAVVFDMGGVIHTTYTDDALKLAFAADLLVYLEKRGLRIPDGPEAFMRRMEAGSRRRKAASEATLREASPEEAWADYHLAGYGLTREQLLPYAEEMAFMWNKRRSRDELRPEAADCMARLRARGIRLGIISNVLSRTKVPQTLAEYNLSGYFESVICSGVCGIRKPDAGIFRLSEATMGLSPDELAYVGDTFTRDVRGARNAGWRLAVRLRDDKPLPEITKREAALESADPAPDITIASLSELPDAIFKFNSECEAAYKFQKEVFV